MRNYESHDIMTRNEKDLLLKDLCARLPYRIRCLVSTRVSTYTGIIESVGLDESIEIIKDNSEFIHSTAITNCKPYLFPLSSMTDEQIYKSPFGYATMDTIREGEVWSAITIGCKEYNDIVDWLNKNHFDYRGLIEKGLAIDATSKNIY